MDCPASEGETGGLRPDFDRHLKLELHGSRITTDAGLLAYHELDDALGLTDMVGDEFVDPRTGRNGRHALTGLFCQSVFERLGGYEDVSDADRLGRDPAMRCFVGGRAVVRSATSTSQMTRFETEFLAGDENLAALADLSWQWIDRVHARYPSKAVVLDMDSRVSPTHGDQEGSGEKLSHWHRGARSARASGTRRTLLHVCVIAALVGSSVPALSQQEDAASQLTGPDAVGNRLESDGADKPDVLDVDLQNDTDMWKARLKERTGLDFGIDYNVLGFTATNSPGEDTSAAGSFRIYGTWELLNRGGPNNGSLVFKVENRHRFTDIPPTGFGIELGYAGLPSSVFSDQGWRATHLFWQQRFAGGRGVGYVGFLDVTDYVDVYALASPWSGFSNLAFQTGSGTIGNLPDGALGAMVGGFLDENIYAVGGIADANADAADLSIGFKNLNGNFETFKTVELGWTTSQPELFVNNAHITIWQADALSDAGVPDGHGINFSMTASIGEVWMPFLRGGWAEGGGSFYSASLSAGFGYARKPGQSMLGVGLNWSRPNEDTFGPNLDDQFTAEIFQQVQLTEGFEITPSIQYILNPALNPQEESNLLVALRLRAAF